MTKTKTVVATIAIWALGISSAAALVNTLARRPAPEPQAALAPEPKHEESPPNIEHFKIPMPLVVAPAKVRSQLRLPVKPAKHPMRCSGWKSLQIGPIDRGVRYCQ
jgi:hypothetical protein